MNTKKFVFVFAVLATLLGFVASADAHGWERNGTSFSISIDSGRGFVTIGNGGYGNGGYRSGYDNYGYDPHGFTPHRRCQDFSGNGCWDPCRGVFVGDGQRMNQCR